jgi:hypothetical protein
MNSRTFFCNFRRGFVTYWCHLDRNSSPWYPSIRKYLFIATQPIKLLQRGLFIIQQNFYEVRRPRMRLPFFGLLLASILRVPQTCTESTLDSTILCPMRHTALGTFRPCFIELRTGSGLVIPCSTDLASSKHIGRGCRCWIMRIPFKEIN